MLPNRFPDQGAAPQYNTVDATLWYFHAVSAYVEASGDQQLLRDLFPVLLDLIEWHRRGTRFGIKVDKEDGLLRAGEVGGQLTWMDAKIGDRVITPRIGKPVEINALWHFALASMARWAQILSEQRVKLLLRFQFGCAVAAAGHVLLQFVAGVVRQLAVNLEHDIFSNPFTLHKLLPLSSSQA